MSLFVVNRTRAAIIFLFLFPACASDYSRSVFHSDLPLDCAHPWVYFDLGDTLVDTRTEPGRLRYLRIENRKLTKNPEAPISAITYLRKLKTRGFHIGLITNIPEKWGSDEAAKIEALKKHVSKNWVDTEPFDWSFFDLGVLIPASDRERKPAPDLFVKALSESRRRGCEVVYQGEDPKEIQMAEQLGIQSFLVGSRPSFFMPL